MCQRRELRPSPGGLKANSWREHLQRDRENWAGELPLAEVTKEDISGANKFEPKRIEVLSVFGKSYLRGA